METLRRFNSDKGTKADLKEYIVAFIGNKAVELMFERKDTSHIADAKDLIDQAFQQLDIDFNPKIINNEPTNEAR